MRALLIPTLLAVFVAACAEAPPAPSTRAEPAPEAPRAVAPPAAQPVAPAPVAAAAPAPAQHPAGLVRVPGSEVCMMNNMHMGKPQIPVAVNGNTYYGCCEMCKAKLNNDPAARTAVDPVSKKPVDKSVAVIGKLPNGATLYFESEANYSAYRGG